jgi:hypothetical protein
MNFWVINYIQTLPAFQVDIHPQTRALHPVAGTEFSLVSYYERGLSQTTLCIIKKSEHLSKWHLSLTNNSQQK